MPEWNWRQAMNAISDVVYNRPPSIRLYDQIYMKAGDLACPFGHFMVQNTKKAADGGLFRWWRWGESNPRPRHAGWRLFHRLGPLLKPPGGERTSRSGRLPP